MTAIPQKHNYLHFLGEEVWTYNTPISEDCLYISITKPAGRRAVNLPVMVSNLPCYFIS